MSELPYARIMISLEKLVPSMELRVQQAGKARKVILRSTGSF
jgi:hypothetical protein